jgi:hypothetical protein
VLANGGFPALVEAKVGFFQKLGDDVCGVGAYTPG